MEKKESQFFFSHPPAQPHPAPTLQKKPLLLQVRTTDTSTPAGRSRFISRSTVAAVGAVISTRRECVRVSNCSRESLLTCGERSRV